MTYEDIDGYSIDVIIYDKNNYHIYNLQITDYPTININYSNRINDINNVVEINVFDNHKKSSQKVIKTNAEFKVLEDNIKYLLNLKRESLGHNTKKNPISLFGMDRVNKYVLTNVEDNDNNLKYVQLFFNNEHKGIYEINPEERNGENEKREEIR